MAVAFVAGALVPTSALACESDADCAPGSACTVETYQYCGGYWGGSTGGADAGVAQDAGAALEDMEPPSGDVECEEVEEAYCTSLPCSEDVDCGEGAACQTWSYTECLWPEPPDCDWETTDCDLLYEQMQPTECHEVDESECLPIHEMPCQQDIDCGDGFDCVMGYWYECDGNDADGTGGGTSGPAAGGSDAGLPTTGGGAPGEPVPEPSCTETLADEGYCELRPLPCDSDAQCPDGMTCQQRYEWVAVDCALDPAVQDGMPDAGSSSADVGEWGGCESYVPSVTMACAPHYWGVVGGDGGLPMPVGGDGGDDAGAPTGDAGIEMPEEPELEDGEGPGESGAHGHGEGLGEGHGHLSKLLGCSAAPGSAPDAAWLWMLAVLVGLAARRPRPGAV